MVGPQVVFQPRLHVPKRLRGEVEAGIGSIKNGLAERWIAIELGEDDGEVIHVQAGMAAVAALGVHPQYRLVADRDVRMTSEEAERRGPPSHARAVTPPEALEHLSPLADRILAAL